MVKRDSLQDHENDMSFQGSTFDNKKTNVVFHQNRVMQKQAHRQPSSSNHSGQQQLANHEASISSSAATRNYPIQHNY